MTSKSATENQERTLKTFRLSPKTLALIEKLSTDEERTKAVIVDPSPNFIDRFDAESERQLAQSRGALLEQDSCDHRDHDFAMCRCAQCWLTDKYRAATEETP